MRNRIAVWAIGNFAISAAVAAVPANAQSSSESVEEAQIGSMDDIIVTARRRTETLQDVPVAVSAETGEALDQKGYLELTDIQRIVPSLEFSSGRGGNGGGVAPFIRGVGEDDFIITADPAVAYYIDGVYVARNFAISNELLDIERVEVLRGPQGSLFGKNTIGGAISVTTRLPDTDTVRLRADVLGGSRNTFRGRASAQVPLSDRWSLASPV